MAGEIKQMENTNERHKFTITRSTWLRGSGDNVSSMLHNPKVDKMCCLGHYGLSRGLSKEDMTNCRTPKYLPLPFHEVFYPFLTQLGIFSGNNEICIKLMDANDNNTIVEKSREEIITRLFAEANIAVTFVD